MEALEAILTRRSTRNYKPDPVEADKLNRILDAGRQSPSGGNNQTSHFLVIRNPAVLQTLAGMAQRAFAAMETDEHTYPATESGLPPRHLMALKGNEVTFID